MNPFKRIKWRMLQALSTFQVTFYFLNLTVHWLSIRKMDPFQMGRILTLTISACMWACQSSSHNTKTSFVDMGIMCYKLCYLVVEKWTQQEIRMIIKKNRGNLKICQQKPLRKLKNKATKNTEKITRIRNFPIKQDHWTNRAITYIYHGYCLIVDLGFVLVLLPVHL